MKVVKLNNNQTLTGAKTRFGNDIPVYDDGQGDLYIHRDSMGITAIVKAQTWEDAYSICEDEFFPSADEEAFEKDWDDMTDHEQACWEESYGYRSCSPGGPTPDEDRGVYAKDLNGDTLYLLTEKFLDDCGITLEVTTDWESVAEEIFDLEWTSANGVYIPHLFCTNVSEEMMASQDECTQECIKNLIPEESVHDYKHYWEDWDTVLVNFKWRGRTLHQSGDLWWVNNAALEKIQSCYGVTDEDIERIFPQR